MKKTIGIKRNFIIIIISILLSACTKKENASQQALLLELVQAEAVMYEHPDSALGVLQGMKVPAVSDKLQNATWALLTVQAKYKNYKEELADSTLINIAYDYFMKQDDARRKAMTLYYKGVLYGKADKTQEAQESYLKAIEEVEKTKDYQLAHLIYSSIGNIYLYNSLNEYALQMFKQSLHYAQLSETKNYICSAYYYLGKVYSVLFNFDNRIKYYKKAIQMADTLHNYKVLINGTNQLAGVYTETKDYQPALSYAQKALRLKETIELPLEKGLEQSYLVIGDIYRHIDKTDSAYYYLNKALAADRIETVCAAYQDLYHLSKKKKDYEKMSQYCDSMIVYQDSIEILNRNKELMDMQEKYNQQKLLNEKNQLKIENNTIIRNVLITLVVVFCLIAILIYIYQRKLIRKEHIIQRNEEEIQLNTLKRQENERIISRNQSRMKELAEQMEANKDAQEQLEEQKNVLSEIKCQNEALQQENKMLQQHIDKYSSSLNEKSKELERLGLLGEENQRLHDRERFLCNQLIKKTDVLYRLKTKPQYMKDEQWEEVKETMNLLFDNYIVRLSTLVPSLTESDLQICCFIKLGIANPGIADLLGIESTSVSKRKLRLKERITQKIGAFGKGQTLDLWLWEF